MRSTRSSSPTQLVARIGRSGRIELVWDVRAITHTSGWFSRLEELNDYVVYVADPADSGWTRQCCRQADVILTLARAEAPSASVARSRFGPAAARGARMELALMHQGRFVPGAAARWLKSLPAALHHHVVDAEDFSRMVRASHAARRRAWSSPAAAPAASRISA